MYVEFPGVLGTWSKHYWKYSSVSFGSEFGFIVQSTTFERTSKQR